MQHELWTKINNLSSDTYDSISELKALRRILSLVITNYNFDQSKLDKEELIYIGANWEELSDIMIYLPTILDKVIINLDKVADNLDMPLKEGDSLCQG